jgi:hypothetical protein
MTSPSRRETAEGFWPLMPRTWAAAALLVLLPMAARHRAADAAVEAQVRILRRALHLPPPASS